MSEKAIIGKKMNMSQLWVEEKVKPYTVVGVEEGSDINSIAVGQRVKVMGVSKGKGFTGVVKRHHFKGGPATHGQSDRHRGPGAIGSTTTPGRVLKGKRMAGRSGNSRVTLKTSILAVNSESKKLLLLGALPGSYGSRVKLIFL